MNGRVINPLIAYAIEHGLERSELIAIAGVDKRDISPDSAALLYAKVKTAAEAGDPFAMCLCCSFLTNGFGTRKDSQEAFNWALRSARMDFAPGHFEAGFCFERSIGTNADLESAKQHYLSALNGGYGFAAYHLAMMYHAGKFGEAFKKNAVPYASQAFEMGESLGAYMLGHWYETGDGVSRDASEALSWYEKASNAGNFLASFRLGAAYKRGELGVTPSHSRSQEYEALSASQSAEAFKT